MTLLDRYDAVLFDLDGTVYRGGQAIPAAADAVQAVRDHDVAVRFVTNNASRAPGTVAGQLRDLGITAEDAEISTSAQAAAALAKERLDAGSQVLVIGTEALADEIRGAGLHPVRTYNPDVTAIVQGLSQDTGWRELSEAVKAIHAGALWIACNTDATLPTEHGQLIGNGAMVAAVKVATGQEPVVAGKPETPLMKQAAAGHEIPAGGRRPARHRHRRRRQRGHRRAAGLHRRRHPEGRPRDRTRQAPPLPGSRRRRADRRRRRTGHRLAGRLGGRRHRHHLAR